MKFKQFMTGLALAGALALGTTAAADAQYLESTEGYYFTPKLLYSHSTLDSFSSQGMYKGFGYGRNGATTGKYNGDDRSANKFGGGFAIGYDYGVYSEYPVRLELEYLYHGKHDQKFAPQTTLLDPAGLGALASTHHFQADIHTVFANAYLDFPTDTGFTPYLGAGIGAAYVDATVKTNERGYLYHEDANATGTYPSPNPGPGYYYYNADVETSGKQNSWNFAWNVSAGLAYQIKDNMAIDVSYRYSDFGKADFGTRTYDLYNKSWISSDGGVTYDRVTNHLGSFSSKSKIDLQAHEVIFGLRITGF